MVIQMTVELYQKLYYLSFSNEEEADTLLQQIIETFNEAMSLKKTVVCLKSSSGYSTVASCGDNEIMENYRRYIVYNSLREEAGELFLVPQENTCFSVHEEKMLNAFLNQLAVILDRLTYREAEISLFKELNKYKQLVSTDKLTGLYNRHHFEEAVEIMEKRKQYPISLVFVDVDGLKIINDYLGHKYGDLALKQTAALLKKTFRENDLVARMGGDEFVIALPYTQYKSAEMRCKSLLSTLKLYNKERNTPPLSFSVGIATTDGGETINNLLHIADQEMYKQKQKDQLKSGSFLRSRCLSIMSEANSVVQQQCMLQL
jgi:diguanylate cyclase (GGDEF)-like protein